MITVLPNWLRIVRVGDTGQEATDYRYSFADATEAMWAKQLVHLFMSSRHIIVTANSPASRRVVLQLYVNQKIVGYICRLEYQPDLMRKIEAHHIAQVVHVEVE